MHRGIPSGTWISSAAIVVEVRSPDDETYEKFDFYFDHGVEEILVAELVTRKVSWFVRGDTTFEQTPTSGLLGLAAHDLADSLGW